MLKKLPVYVSIIAAVVVIIMGFGFHYDSFEIIKRIIAIILVSFVVSYIMQIYFNKKVFYKDNKDENSTEEKDGESDTFDLGRDEGGRGFYDDEA